MSAEELFSRMMLYHQELRMDLVPSILIAATLLTTIAVTFDFHVGK